ncbi:MAG: hypothetical protein ACJ8CB_05295, partial [Ktedonobacteraceae bacterium]
FPAYVTIHQRSDVEGAAAFALPRPKESIKTLSREDVLGRIQVMLAARAAEELFLDLNMTGVTSDLERATQLAAAYVGAYGMDGTLISYAAFANPLTGGSMHGPDLVERTEGVLQSQFKAVKHLLQEHSEALIAVAEALIEQDELIADQIKGLIDEADAKRVARVVISDFEAILGNGHSNGYALAGTSGNGDGNTRNTPLIEGPRIDSAPSSSSSLTPHSEASSLELPFTDDGPSSFIDK